MPDERTLPARADYYRPREAARLRRRAETLLALAGILGGVSMPAAALALVAEVFIARYAGCALLALSIVAGGAAGWCALFRARALDRAVRLEREHARGGTGE